MTQKTYYKVVARNYNQYQGCHKLQSVMLTTVNTYIVTYYTNKFVYGHNGSKLFVFDSLDSAKYFVNGYCCGNAHIYECKIKGKIYKPKKISSKLMIAAFDKFWNAKKYKKKNKCLLKDTIKGTVCVDSVKLIKEVL